jgi:hypothetical protein
MGIFSQNAFKRRMDIAWLLSKPSTLRIRTGKHRRH